MKVISRSPIPISSAGPAPLSAVPLPFGDNGDSEKTEKDDVEHGSKEDRRL